MQLRVFLFLFAVIDCVVGFAQTPELITRGSTNASAAGLSLACAMTPDGRFVVFSSHANNLVTNDSDNTYADVFVRELSNNNVTLVTKAATGTGGGDGH